MFPSLILNWISGKEVAAQSGRSSEKFNPHDGSVLCSVARSDAADINAAVAAARAAQEAWADTPAVRRGEILHEIVMRMKARADEIARIVAVETGKSFKDAKGETGGAIQLGLFYA